MKKLCKKGMSLLLALFLLCGAFALVSCDGNKGSTQGGTTPNSTPSGEASLMDQHAAAKDFDGRDFNILTVSNYNELHYFATDDATATGIEASCYARTLYLEERYNVELKVIEVEKPHESLMEMAGTDTQAYDLMFPHPKVGIASLATAGYMVDMLTLNELDFSQDWWVNGMVEGYKINGGLYYTSSDAAIVSQGLAGLIYNKDLYNTYGFEEDLYQVVYDKEWTQEKMLEIMEVISSSTSGSTGTYGFIHHNSHTYGMAVGMGYQILKRDADGTMTFAPTKESTVKIAEAVYDIFYEHEKTVFAGSAATNAVLGSSEIWLLFSGGKGLFMSFDIGQTYSLLRDLRFDVGYLPFPMLENEVQKDYKMFCGSGLYGIPTTAVNAEDSALIFDAYSIYSMEHVKPAFFEIIIGGRLSENPADFEMLNYLHMRKSFDLGFTLDEGNIFYALIHTAAVAQKNPQSVGRLLTQYSSTARNLEKLANGT